MMKLVDGPAKGTYMVKRAPLYLRAVVNDKGGTDVLDQPSDSPLGNELVYVYSRIGEARNVHLSMADRRKSGFYAIAEYEWMDAVLGEELREKADWLEWCAEHGDV